MNITFILTGSAHRPIGGFKVVYEYSNRLVVEGHNVTLVHPQMVSRPASIVIRLLKFVKFVIRKISKSYLPNKWFKLDSRVNVNWCLYATNDTIPDGDVVIATGWDTANVVNSLLFSKGEKFYFLQHLETWASKDSQEVIATWKLPLKKVAIARWLVDYAHSLNEDACYVPNGLDFEKFDIDVPLVKRKPATVMVLNHWRPYKGTMDAIAALTIVKKTYSELNVILFGVTAPPANLPVWIEYHRNPAQEKLRDLYNRSSIFLAPSHTEGWGLTACEAMMCGCALIATDVGGHREFAIDGETALLTPVGDINNMAANVIRAISNDQLRFDLAADSKRNLERFNWESSAVKFIGALTNFRECADV